MKNNKANLFVVGAAKAGTTYLYGVLDTHTSINMATVKEPHFFASVESRNPAEYLAPRDGKTYHSKVITDKVIYNDLFDWTNEYKYRGEASPSYLLDTQSAEKIKEYNPNAKIIVVLRNPIDRAYSHYLMEYRNGYEMNDNFRVAIDNDLKVTDKVWGKKGFFYIELGRYAEQIKRYVDTFSSENVLILTFQDIKDKTTLYKKITNFLSINPTSFNEEEADNSKNTASIPKNKFALYFKRISNHSSVKYLLEYIPTDMKTLVRNKLFSSKGEQKTLSTEDKLYLEEIYKSTFKELKERYSVVFE